MKFSLFNIDTGKSKKGSAKKSILPPFSSDDGVKRFVVTGSDYREIVDALHGSYSITNLINLFHTIGEVYAPIDAIASRAVGAKFGFRDKKTKDVISNNENLNKLITSPNPLQNFKQLLYEGMCYELVTGKDFWYNNIPVTLAKDYKNIASQYNLPADKTEPIIPKKLKLFSATTLDDIIKGYIMDKGGEDEQVFPTEHVMYRRRTNLKWKGKKIEGRSPLLSAELALINLIAVYKARGFVYLKRGAMGMWVSAKSDHSGNVALNDKERKDLEDNMDNDYGITHKKKRTVGITSAPVTFEKSSMSIQELQPFDETKADAAVIYGVFGVPFELAPNAEGETFSNQLTAERSLYQNNVIPYTESWCESLTASWGIDKWGYELFCDFSGIEVLQQKSDIEKTRIEAYTKLYKDGGITYNEWLNKLGYPSRGKEFDKYINELESVPMAVKIGVGGTQAMQSVVADPNLSEQAKAELLVLLFGITIEQARVVVVTAPKPSQPDAPTN